MYQVKFFKGCLPQIILLGPFLNSLPQIILVYHNIDRLEEILSGSGTRHRVNGIAVQIGFIGSCLKLIESRMKNQRNEAKFLQTKFMYTMLVTKLMLLNQFNKNY